VGAIPFQSGMQDCYRSVYCPGAMKNTIDEEKWDFSPVKTKPLCEDTAMTVCCLREDCEEYGHEWNMWHAEYIKS
jgi:hypothetical protein